MHQAENQNSEPEIKVKKWKTIPDRSFVIYTTNYERIFVIEFFVTLLLFVFSCFNVPFIFTRELKNNYLQLALYGMFVLHPVVSGAVLAVSLWAMASDRHRTSPRSFVLLGAVPSLWFALMFLLGSVCKLILI